MEKYAKVRFLLNFQTWQIAVYTFENNSIMVEMESSANLYPHRGTIGRGGGGWMEPISGAFDGIHFRGGGAAGGL